MDLGSSVMIMVYRAMLYAVAMRYITALVWLICSDIRVLWRYHRTCTRIWSPQSWRARLSRLYGLRIPLRQCLKLFVALPSPPVLKEEGNDPYNDRWYQKVYRVMRTLPPPCSDPIDAQPARTLQALLVWHTFRKLLGVSLSLAEAGVLTYKGGVSVMTLEFLEFCGCQTIPLNRSHLELHLPLFVAFAQSQRVGRNPTPLSRLRKLRAWWQGISRHLLRLYWTQSTALRMQQLSPRLRPVYRQALRSGRLQARTLARATQTSLVIVLADTINVQATTVLADLCEDLSGRGYIRHRIRAGSDQAYSDPFTSALETLDSNYEIFMRTLKPRGKTDE
jgi:hypothetical protein